MPIFEYTCNDCHKRNEVLIQGQQEPVCPECGSSDLHKELSVFAAPHESSGNGISAPAAHPAGCGCCAPGGACGLN